MNIKARLAVIDEFTHKLVDSGHSILAIRVFVIKKHVMKNNKCLETSETFHRAAATK